MKRICSSSTLIASDLAKRSPKDSAPSSSAPAVDHFANPCPSSKPLLAISSGGGGQPSDELSDMVWSGNADDLHPQPENSNSDNNAALVTTSSSRSPSNPQSPKCSFGVNSNEFGVGVDGGGGDYSHAYFSMHGGAKYEDVNGGNDHTRLGNLGLVQQVPMFALWNE